MRALIPTSFPSPLRLSFAGKSESSVLAVLVCHHIKTLLSSGHILIQNTVENTKMNDCYFEKKDWRLCREEVRTPLELSDLNPHHVYRREITSLLLMDFV